MWFYDVACLVMVCVCLGISLVAWVGLFISLFYWFVNSVDICC